MSGLFDDELDLCQDCFESSSGICKTHAADFDNKVAQNKERYDLEQLNEYCITDLYNKHSKKQLIDFGVSIGVPLKESMSKRQICMLIAPKVKFQPETRENILAMCNAEDETTYDARLRMIAAYQFHHAFYDDTPIGEVIIFLKHKLAEEPVEQVYARLCNSKPWPKDQQRQNLSTLTLAAREVDADDVFQTFQNKSQRQLCSSIATKLGKKDPPQPKSSMDEFSEVTALYTNVWEITNFILSRIKQKLKYSPKKSTRLLLCRCVSAMISEFCDKNGMAWWSIETLLAAFSLAWSAFGLDDDSDITLTESFLKSIVDTLNANSKQNDDLHFNYTICRDMMEELMEFEFSSPCATEIKALQTRW